MKNKILLDEVIKGELEDLKTKQQGSEEYKSTGDTVAKLLDRSIEMEKIALEAETKQIENELKEQQIKDENRDRKIKNYITIGGIASTTGLAIWGTLKSLKFEETGTITTSVGKLFINKLIPKK